MIEDPTQLVAQAYATEHMQTLHRALVAEAEVTHLRTQVAQLIAQQQEQGAEPGAEAPE